MLIDKAPGPTSHDVVGQIRRVLGMRRIGHAGTLDPFASGLLVVLVGRATRLARFLVGLDKRYDGQIVLGTSTVTDDVCGTVIHESDTWRDLSNETIAHAMAGLVGRIRQRPPAFSAKHVKGIRAHRLARRGILATLDPEEVEVQTFELLDRRGPFVSFAAAVGSGTYVRALARDLGDALGCGAHLGALRRTHVGGFALTEAIDLEEVETDAIRAPAEALSHLQRVELSADDRELVVHGRSVDVPNGTRDGTVAMVHGGSLVAVAERDGDRLKPRVVLEQ